MAPRTRSDAAMVQNVDEECSINTNDFKSKISKYTLTTGSEDNPALGDTKSMVTTTAKVIQKRASPSTSSPKLKRQRTSSTYAAPSKYAHLQGITDSIAPNLLVLLVGHNPGVATATAGHAYAHPSNHFWKLLHLSGLTDRRCLPQEDKQMPELYSLGLTNIVSRPTKDTAELSKEEQTNGTPILEEKIRAFRPEVVCMVGKSIWEAVWRYKYGKNPKKDEFKYGWQDERHNLGVVNGDGDDGWTGARVFVATTTSGLAAGMKPAEKEAIWKPLGDWAKQRRLERAEEAVKAVEIES